MKPMTAASLLIASFFILSANACKQTPVAPAVQEPFVFPKQDSSVTLLFCGDIMLHEPQIQAAFDPQSGNYHFLPCFQHVASLCHQADFTIANLETTLGDNEFSGYPRFRSPWQLALDLKRAGVSVLVLANNHCCDQGERGIRQTLHFLDSLQIPHTGIFRDSLPHPLYLRKNGFKIALLNYTYGTNGLPVPKGYTVSLLDTNRILNDIVRTRKDSATHVVAFVHWGHEYHTSPSPEQRKLARWLHARGVDITIGSHPHVVQPIEYRTQGADTIGVTAYSLGNFISNQSYQGTEVGLCAYVVLSRDAGSRKRYRVTPLKCYTHKPYENGIKQFYVIPETTPDSLLSAGDNTRKKHFFKHTDSILLQN